MKNVLSVCVLASCTLLTACEGMGPKEQQYTAAGCATGAIGGGLLGVLGGHGNSSAALMGAGAGLLAGCLAGNAIGRQLDARDRAQAEQALLYALNAPPTRSGYVPPQQWHSDHTSNRGTIQVQKVTKTASGECRQAHETAYIQSQEVVQTINYCRNSSGGWAQA
jgi:surface antigen